MSRDTYAEVTAKLVEAFEAAAEGHWQRPWSSIVAAGDDAPVNCSTGRPYRGVNTLLLASAAYDGGYVDSRWGTYRAWAEKGGQVRKGERHDDSAAPEQVTGTILMARGYAVFNAHQVDGIELRSLSDSTPEELAEKASLLTRTVEAFCSRESIALHRTGAKAYYDRSADAITVPPRLAFDTETAMAAVLAHEAAHATGAEKRLNRLDKLARFGNDSYAAEEVVAEMTAAFLGAATSTAIDQAQSVAYLRCWIGVMKRDSRAIFTAASAAQAAADLILSAVEATVDDAPVEADAVATR